MLNSLTKRVISSEFSNERELIKEMYDIVYSEQARKIGKKIRDEVLSKDGNIGQNSILSKKEIELLAKKAKITSSSRILDICCGDGGISIYFAKKYKCQTMGIDFSNIGIRTADTLARARRTQRISHFAVSTAESLPFKTSYYDLVYSCDSFVHIYDKKTLLNECYRVLKPGGKLMFYDWVDMDGVPEDIQRNGKLWGYIYVISISDYKKLLEGTGFESTRVHDNSKKFSNIIAKWEGINLSYKYFLIQRCGIGYFNTAKERWRLARELSQSNILGQALFSCTKPAI